MGMHIFLGDRLLLPIELTYLKNGGKAVTLKVSDGKKEHQIVKEETFSNIKAI